MRPRELLETSFTCPIPSGLTAASSCPLLHWRIYHARIGLDAEGVPPFDADVEGSPASAAHQSSQEMDTNNIDVVRAIVKAARPSDAKRAPPRKPQKPPPALQRAAALVQGVDACESALKRCARAYAMPDDDSAMTDAARDVPSTRASGRSCGNAKLLWRNRLLIMENRGREKRTPGAASRSRGRARRRWPRYSGTSRF